MKYFVVMLLACVAIASASPMPPAPKSLNNPPNAPDSIQGVDGGIINQHIRFSTRATDPDGDSVSIIFYYDTTQSSNNSGWLGPVPGGTFVSDSVGYPNAGTYYVVAYAKDTAGAISDPSPVKAITIASVEIAWSFNTPDGDAFYSSPAIGMSPVTGDTIVYCGCDNALIYAFNARTGADLGFFCSLNQDAFSSSPVISAGGQRVYIADDGGWLYCLSADGLADLSHYPSSDTWVPGMQPFFSTPAVHGSQVYVGRDDGFFYRFDDYAGQLTYNCSYNTSADISSSPAINSDGTRIVVGNDSGYIYCFDDSLGLVWRVYSGAPISSSPAISGTTVYYGSDDQILHAVRLSDGSNVGPQFEASDFITSSPIVDAAGNVYFCVDNGTVYCVNNGAEVWHLILPFGEDASATCCLAPDTTLIINTDDGSVYALDLGTGAVRYRFEWPEPPMGSHRHKTADLNSSVTIGPRNGLFYAGSPNGGFFAVKVDKPSFLNGSLPNAPWPKFHHDIANSGWSGWSGIGEPEISWQFQTPDGDGFYSSPAIGVSPANGDTAVYCGCDNALIYAFNARTGGSLGSFASLNEDAFSSSPVISSDSHRVYVADDGGWLYCLNAAGLGKLSNYPPNDTWVPGMQPFFSTPAVYGNNIYIGRDDGYFYRFDDNAGQLTYVTSYNTMADISSSPAINSDGTRIVVGNDSGYVYCFNDTLGLVWSVFSGAPVKSSPAISGNTVYYGGDDSILHARSLADGSPVDSQFRVGSRIRSSPVVDAAGRVYFCVENGTVYCIYNGTEVWDRSLLYSEHISATCCLAPDTTLIINTDEGSVYGLYVGAYRPGSLLYRISWPEPPNGSHRNKTVRLSSSATIGPGNGLFFAGSPNGGFFAVKVAKPSFLNGSLPNAPWPKFHHDIANSGWSDWSGTAIAEKAVPGGQPRIHPQLECPSLFRSEVTIKYYLAKPGRAGLKVYSADGALVRNLSAEVRSAGVHQFAWDGRDDRGKSVRPGIYYCRATADRSSMTRKLVKVN
jgi:outer membrane protein assembly factor BamB